MHEAAIAKLIKTTEKHRTIITHISKITHCSKSCNLRKCSVTFMYHAMKLALFITVTIVNNYDIVNSYDVVNNYAVTCPCKI